MMPSFRRLFILLVLLPQLLVLGLGTGVVLCVAPDGHVQFEVAASTCCEGTRTLSSEVAVEGNQGAGECGWCTDLRVAVDTRVSRAPDGTDVATGATAALPADSAVRFGRARPALDGRRGVRTDPAQRHLLHLASVLLRC